MDSDLELRLRDESLSRERSDSLIELKAHPCVTAYHRVPPRPARWAEIPASLSPQIGAVLAARGITRLYSHQADSFLRARSGENTVVVTPTASGKTLCYDLPVLDSILENPDRRALFHIV